MDIVSTILGSSAIGAGAYATHKALSPVATIGAPQTTDPAALVDARSVGAQYPVVGGAIAWGDRFEAIAAEDGTAYVRDRSGRRIPTNTVGAAWAAYDIVIDLGVRANELEGLFYESLDQETAERFYNGFLTSGSYDTSTLSGLSKGILTSLLGCWGQWTNAIRVMGRLYQANGMSPSLRPQRWIGRNIDLSRIIFNAGIANPQADHARGRQPLATVSEVAFAGEWRLIGAAFLGKLIDAYPGMMQIPASDVEAAGDSIASDVEMSVPESEMGIAVAALIVALLKGIAFIIVAYGVVRILESVASGILALAGVNVEYFDENIRLYREAMRRCADTGLDADERDAACRTAETLATRIESYSRGVALPFRIALIVGGVAATGAGLYYLTRKRKAIRAKKKPKRLEAQTHE